MKKFLFLFLFFNQHAFAQTQPGDDSVQMLQNVIINAYESNHKLIDVAAPVSVVSSTDLSRYNNTTIISALNAKPGVRMEERSPGSYRLSIRGSSLRSPFGVRNVKVYYDGIPYTDPGGNTYLNQLGFYNFQSVEVIKGPAGSLYGAGTGGVLLIRNDAEKFIPGATVSYESGSYNLQNVNVNTRFGNEEANNTINFQHLGSDGYRDHTAMHRDVLTWDAKIKSAEKHQLSAHFLFADLYYQTPGALTKKEYDENPQSARKAFGSFPSAETAQAAIFQKSFVSGLTYQSWINENWQNTTVVYGAYSQLRNPNFRNYSRTSEPHFGGRTMFQFKKQFSKTLLTINGGAEFQQSFNTQRQYATKNGNPDTLQTDDEIYNSQGFVFLQANAELNDNWILTAGASVNENGLNFTRLSEIPTVMYKRKFNNQVAPRFAILKKIKQSISLYASIARGFSPPTTSELLPSTNNFNTTLQAEHGIDYEIGTRGTLMKSKLYFDINAFFYKLKSAIVQRRDSSGADYFINAGSASQNGVETYLSYNPINRQFGFLRQVFLYASNTWNDFHYKQFKQINNDFSGNELPGIAPETFSGGIDVSSKPGFYLNATYFYSSRISLNDTNTDFANAYDLFGVRIGYKKFLSKQLRMEIFAGAENILNEKYSLGNDINATGGRYYNAAPGRNFYAGIVFRFNKLNSELN